MNCCDANGECKQGQSCPARETPAHPFRVTMQDEPESETFSLWFPVFTFFLGIAIGGGLVMLRVTGALG